MAPAARFEGRVSLAAETVLTSGASFVRGVLLTTRDGLLLREPVLREVRFKRSGTVLAQGASFEESSLLTARDRFWLREPVLREVRY